VSINGANRLGSNSLTELLVFGARAGADAAAHAREATGPDDVKAVLAQALDEERRLRIEIFSRERGGERIATIRTELQTAMEEGAGIYRDRAGLLAAAERMAELRARLAHASLDDVSLTFNTELTGYLELENLMDVAEAILHSALHREESRGAHQRTDFPERDDDRWLAHSLALRQPDGEPRVELLPVSITRWPPGQRVYGR
jgi:fumarate reductase flavoprotein subunit